MAHSQCEAELPLKEPNSRSPWTPRRVTAPPAGHQSQRLFTTPSDKQLAENTHPHTDPIRSYRSPLLGRGLVAAPSPLHRHQLALSQSQRQDRGFSDESPLQARSSSLNIGQGTDTGSSPLNGGDNNTPSSPIGREDQIDAFSPTAKPPRPLVSVSPEPEKPLPRLVLAKLVLENFKSYAGRQEIGPFNASFSAIVGPNGSGKSNVIDSLLFVFGFRASKMRHGKLTNLIHKSEKHLNIQSCRVEVHFEYVLDRREGGIPYRIANSELVVARNVSFASGSTYDINGTRSSYGEVTSLLKEKGIDLEHKRFLILQGEVESIAMMKSKAETGGEDGLLEYLEDIIGTSGFKPKIEEAEADVESLREGLIEVQSRYDYALKSIDALEERRVIIEKFLQNSNEISVRKFKLLQHESYRSRIKSDIAQNEIAVHQAKLEHEMARNQAAHEELVKLEAELQEKAKDLTVSTKSLQNAKKAAKTYKLETTQLEEKKGQLEARQKKLLAQVDQAERELSMSQKLIENFDQDNETLINDIETNSVKLKDESQKLAIIQNNLKEKTASISSEIEKLQVKAEPWRSQIQEKESELRKADAEATFIRNAKAEDKKRYDSIISQAKAISETGRLEEKAYKKFLSTLRTTEESLAAVELQLDQARERHQEAQALVNAQRNSVSAARESRSTSQNQSRMVTELMQLRDKGVLKGLYGRLGSLGSIDPKYDVAVSTASPGLDDLVVDTVETGQKCIQILKERKLGRAKFILLDKLAKQNLSAIQTPENVPRLFDLIKPRDPKFAPAFYSVVKDTLVAESMDQARRVAYGQRRFRTVTLAGALVEISGAMIGGGKPTSGRMAAHSVESISLDELTALEKSLASAEMEYAESNSALDNLTSQVKNLNREKVALMAEIEKQKLTVDECEAQLKELKVQRDEIKASISSRAEADASRLSMAESRHAELMRERDALVEQSAPVEAELEQLQKQILDAGGLELRFQQSRVSDLRGFVESLRERQASSILQRKQALQKVKKLEIELTESQTELSSVEGAVEEQLRLLEGRGGQTNLLDEAEKEAFAAFTADQEFLQEGKDKLASLQLENDETKALTDELKRKLEDTEAALTALRDRMVQIQSSIDSLQLYDVSEARNLRNDEPQQYSKSTSDNRTEATQGRTKNSLPSNSDRDPSANDDRMDVDEQEAPSLAPAGPFTPCEFVTLSSQDLERLNIEKLKDEIKYFQEQVSKFSFHQEELDEYKSKFAEYKQRKSALDAAVQNYDARKQTVADLRQQRLDDFMTGFDIITRKLKQMYKLITLTGNADLELVDSLDPFSEGISFSVMPPGKSWKNISNLSGGEKTLSSLALVFALHHYKPTPLYFMDEIDAALDFRNVSIIANYIKERTTRGQFVVISLRNNMFELADRLIGIYKVNSMTRSVTLDLLAEAEQTITLPDETKNLGSAEA